MKHKSSWKLNREIAEAIGCAFIEQDDEWIVTTPDGKRWHGGVNPFNYSGVPGLWDWQNDIHVALQLCEAHRLDVHLGLTMPQMPDVPMPGTRYASLWASQISHRATGYGETYAEAICRAFLTFKKAAK